MIHKLGDVAKAEYHNSPIRIRAVISGKSATPYKIPKRIRIECSGHECDCGLKNGEEIVVMPIDERFLMFIDAATTSIPRIIKLYAKTKCKDLKCDIKETQNVLRIFISQPTGEKRTEWNAAQVSYFVGHNIDANITYELDGYSTVDPKSQIATYVFMSAKKAKTDIESFELTAKSHKRLKAFQRKFESVEDVFAYLGDLYESYALNVTKIYERFLLHLAVDIVFHSALEMRLPNGRMQPARIDAIVLGDTRCGKGHVAEGLAGYYNVGEVVGAENCTFAGLVGGAQQIGSHWVISWGRIPLNDRGIVVVDEASELQATDWTRLSRIRSEGVAEVAKIVQQMTNARTRLLFLANPPSRAMASYTFGIHALKDLVHAPEDIARFDFACIVSHDEVPIENINKMHGTTKEMYSAALERELIMWIWSRTSDQIVFTEKAMDEIFATSNRFGKIYDIGIPLVQGENIRIKISKIAIAFAGRLYSCSDDGEKLEVKRLHVQCAAAFLQGLYKSDVNGYYEHSLQNKALNPELQQRNIEGLVAYFKAYQSQDDIYQYLLNNNFITAKDIVEYLGVSQQVSIEFIHKLLHFRCVVKKGQNQAYVKTSHFTKWLRAKISANRKKKQ